MLQKTELIECCEPLRERDRAEDLRADLRIARVRDALAVLLAVAGVDELGRRLERAAVERGRRGHDLERRARRIEALGRAVEQRRRVRARGRADARDRGEVLLDDVRVEGRARGHAPGSGPSSARSRPRRRTSRAAAHRDLLRARVERQVEVVALDRHALQLVELAPRDAGDRAVRAGEVVVLGALDPGARAVPRRVADDVRREVAVGVLAEVVGLAARPCA